MKQFSALWKETWFLWVALLAFGLTFSILYGGVFIVVIPIAIFSFIYFALVRFDDKGNHRWD